MLKQTTQTMQNKLKMEIFSAFDSIGFIAKLVDKNNSGEAIITLEDLQNFLRMYKVIYPISTASLGYMSSDGNTLNISEDGGTTIAMSITSCNLYEISEQM